MWPVWHFFFICLNQLIKCTSCGCSLVFDKECILTHFCNPFSFFIYCFALIQTAFFSPGESLCLFDNQRLSFWVLGIGEEYSVGVASLEIMLNENQPVCTTFLTFASNLNRVTLYCIILCVSTVLWALLTTTDSCSREENTGKTGRSIILKDWIYGIKDQLNNYIPINQQQHKKYETFPSYL